MRDRDWDDFRVVLCIARTTSFAAAARHLAVNESTVSRRLQHLENRLAAKLFDRVNGKLILTDAGQTMVERAEIVEHHIQAANQEISGIDQRAAGKVRLTAVPIIANRVLAPALKSLTTTHPDLEIDLIADPRDLSLSKRESDIALRLARPHSDTKAITRRIATLEYATYARTDLDPDALSFIGYDDSMRDLPQAKAIAADVAAEKSASISVRVKDAETLLACLKAGIGKSYLPVMVGDREPDLVRIPGKGRPFSRELWLMVHSDLRDLIRIRVTMDWLVRTFEQTS